MNVRTSCRVAVWTFGVTVNPWVIVAVDAARTRRIEEEEVTRIVDADGVDCCSFRLLSRLVVIVTVVVVIAAKRERPTGINQREPDRERRHRDAHTKAPTHTPSEKEKEREDGRKKPRERTKKIPTTSQHGQRSNQQQQDGPQERQL